MSIDGSVDIWWDPRDVIAAKRDGCEVAGADLERFMAAYLAGSVTDAQVAAFLMAGVVTGFSGAEARALTDAFVRSGARVDLGGLPGPIVDKHSTGGVADSTTLVAAPLAAACGLRVAKLSGRALGHTGGTIDKLESIPGLSTTLDAARFRAQVERIGLVIGAASDDLVPADRRVYALRDATGTVANPALIAASVMSKKIAGGAGYVVLDVKTGDGALLAELDAARNLAQLCVDIGSAHGLGTAALVTDMSQPLGPAIGDALEVAAAVSVLRVEASGRLAALAVELVGALLELVGEPRSPADVEAVLHRGAALEKFREFVQAQGGDPALADSPWEVLPVASVVVGWGPPHGTVEGFDVAGLGRLARVLAARGGPSAGLEVLASIGDEVGRGEECVRVHAATEAEAARALELLPGLVRTGPAASTSPPLVLERLGIPEPGA